jgi:hypothetical protein
MDVTKRLMNNLTNEALCKTFSINSYYLQSWSQYTVLYLVKVFGIDAKLLVLLITLLL